MEGISNMVRCPLAVLLIFKTHQKNERQRKMLSKEYRQELERRDFLKKRSERKMEKDKVQAD